MHLERESILHKHPSNGLNITGRATNFLSDGSTLEPGSTTYLRRSSSVSIYLDDVELTVPEEEGQDEHKDEDEDEVEEVN